MTSGGYRPLLVWIMAHVTQTDRYRSTAMHTPSINSQSNDGSSLILVFDACCVSRAAYVSFMMYISFEQVEMNDWHAMYIGEVILSSHERHWMETIEQYLFKLKRVFISDIAFFTYSKYSGRHILAYMLFVSSTRLLTDTWTFIRWLWSVGMTHRIMEFFIHIINKLSRSYQHVTGVWKIHVFIDHRMPAL